MNSSTPGFLVCHYLPKFVQTHIHWVSDAIQPYHPPSPSSPLALSLSQNQVPNKYALPIGWPKHWNFSFSISTSNEYSWLISFRINWFDLLAVQWSLKSLLQHNSSKASILQCSAFFMVQFSHPYMTASKTIALARWTFVSKVMCLLFNTMSRFVTAFFSLLLLEFFNFLNKFILFNWMWITLQYCSGFAIHCHEPATGVHVIAFLLRNKLF